MDIKPFMKKRLMFAYEVSLPLMALFSLVTLIALGSSYFHPERQPLLIYLLDHAIWLVFTADLLVRLCFADSLRAFVAEPPAGVRRGRPRRALHRAQLCI